MEHSGAVQGLRQPAAGFASTALVVFFVLLVAYILRAGSFTGWFAYYVQCAIPPQIVLELIWRRYPPQFLTAYRQPLKGIAQIGAVLLFGGGFALLDFVAVGRSVPMPTPMLQIFTITAILTTLCLALSWRGWPFTELFRNPVAAGLTLLLFCHALAYAIFRGFFNFAFLVHAPVYVPALDPRGIYPAWNALAFYLAVVAGLFLILGFDSWPVARLPKLASQPMQGLIWAAVIFFIGWALYAIGVQEFGMDAVDFLVRIPLPIIFGSIVVRRMFDGTLFSRMAQPAKGTLIAIAATVAGIGLAWFYRLISPSVAGQLAAGPPRYDLEIWLATAILSVTFPFLLYLAEFLRFWPLQRNDTR